MLLFWGTRIDKFGTDGGRSCLLQPPTYLGQLTPGNGEGGNVLGANSFEIWACPQARKSGGTACPSEVELDNAVVQVTQVM
jgi:hypothetical protein